MSILNLVRCILIVMPLLSLAESRAEVPVEAFARMPTFTDLEISPGGKYLAARLFRDERYVVNIFEILDGNIKYVYGFQEDDTFSISWFEWASPDRLLASAAFTGARGDMGRVQTAERRLVVIDAVAAEVLPLFRRNRDDLPIQIQDRIVSFLPHDPDHILVQYSSLSHPGVYEIDVTKLTRHRKVLGGRKGVSYWMADADGDVRLGAGVRNQKEPSLIIREKGSKNWRDFSHRLGVPGVAFEPVGFSNVTGELYVRSNHEGDPIGLYSFDTTTDEFGPLIYKHEFVDVSSVHIDEKTGELLSVNFVDEDVSTVRLIERPIREQIRALQQQLADRDLQTYSISSDGQHAVLRLSDEQRAGSFLLYNGVKNAAIALPPQYPDLVDVPLGRTFSTEYVARDGLRIPAFITLPPQYDTLDSAKDIPFVIHPHGGPGARDFKRFSFDVQFFVSRGYGVLQMNFRGSTGYGQAFKDAGSREWGQAMQDDITDGVNWLAEKNYADINRIAIVGGSYGGYAALMGAVKTPDLYQCAISFAGVADLPNLLSHAGNFKDGKYATRFVGDRWKDRKMLAANSPARRAEEIRIPVLLIHGDQDTSVEIEQSEKMAKELKKYGKDYKFVVLENGDHHHSLYANRLLYLQEMDQFLGDCLQ